MIWFLVRRRTDLDARTYGIKADRKLYDWVEWMLTVTTECLRVSRGSVWWVWSGCTRDRCYQPGPEGVAWEWLRRGLGELIFPCVWTKGSGIPGSGGTQEFRHDHEYIHGFKRPGPLAFADNKACGHAPKWGPGGEVSYRNADGKRVNATPCGNPRLPDGRKPLPRSIGRDKHGKPVSSGTYVKDPTYQPTKSNPGTIIHALVGGGGRLGDRIAHRSEAPFPEKLPERFIRTYCPEGGIVLDCFGGSGTTGAVAERWGRRWLSFDIRESQADIARRRIGLGGLF